MRDTAVVLEAKPHLPDALPAVRRHPGRPGPATVFSGPVAVMAWPQRTPRELPGTMAVQAFEYPSLRQLVDPERWLTGLRRLAAFL